jgi:phage terminase small subunit
MADNEQKQESAYGLLSPKRRAFVDAYFTCKLNGTKAAIKAGYSKKTAMTQAEQLLRILEVKQAIAERSAIMQAKSRLKADDVVKELRRIGFSDITKIVRWAGNVVTVRDSAKIPHEFRVCISEITRTETATGSTLKIKLHNKIAALELVSRILGFDQDKADENEKLEKIKAAVKDIVAALNQAKQPAKAAP